MADWRSNKKSTQERLTFLLNNEILSDVTFLVGDKAGKPKKLFAHSLILSMGSEVFEAMFFGALAEKTQDIRIPDTTPKAFLTMLRYLYVNEVEFETVQNAMEIYYLSKKYAISYLQDLCQDYIGKCVTPGNACEVYECACVVADDPLKLRCLGKFRTETPGVLSSASFKTAELTTVQKIMRSRWLSISEYGLFNSVLEWAQNTASRKGLGQDSETLRAIMQPLFPYFRFLAMSVTEVASGPVENGILTPTEAYAILLRIAKPNTTAVTMPEAFSLERKARSSAPHRHICWVVVTSMVTKTSHVSADTTFILQLSVKGTDCFVASVQLPLHHLDYNSQLLTLTASVKCINVATGKVMHSYQGQCQVYCVEEHDTKDGHIGFSKPMYLESCTVVELRVNLQGKMSKCAIKSVKWDSSRSSVIYDDLELNISLPEQNDLKDYFPLSAISFLY